MKTLEQILPYKAKCIDGRDLARLTQFMTADQIEAAEFEFDSAEQRAAHTPTPFTRENILATLENDVAFGFEKALNQRGLSAGLMHEVVRMWNSILEEGLEHMSDYEMYGLPLFKATALKYGFPNPIGGDTGAENKYDTQ